MKINMGTIDRIIRAIVGIVSLLVAFLAVSGAWQIVLWVIGGILLLTAIMGFCPLYSILHVSTKGKG